MKWEIPGKSQNFKFSFKGNSSRRYHVFHCTHNRVVSLRASHVCKYCYILCFLFRVSLHSMCLLKFERLTKLNSYKNKIIMNVLKVSKGLVGKNDLLKTVTLMHINMLLAYYY